VSRHVINIARDRVTLVFSDSFISHCCGLWPKLSSRTDHIALLSGYPTFANVTHLVKESKADLEYGMPSKTIMLSPQSIIELAHNAMVPHGMRCEWSASGKSCMVQLGSWELVKKVCFVLAFRNFEFPPRANQSSNSFVSFTYL
jgi:hypothetical protein